MEIQLPFVDDRTALHKHFVTLSAVHYGVSKDNVPVFITVIYSHHVSVLNLQFLAHCSKFANCFIVKP